MSVNKALATSHPVHCTESRRPNGSAFPLARIDVTGIFLWCKLCRKEHALSRVALCAIWDELEEQSRPKNGR